MNTCTRLPLEKQLDPSRNLSVGPQPGRPSPTYQTFMDSCKYYYIHINAASELSFDNNDVFYSFNITLHEKHTKMSYYVC